MRGKTIQVLSICGIVAGSYGCQKEVSLSSVASTAAQEQDRSKPVPLTRQDCQGAGAQEVDVNNDQRPDIRHVLAGGKRICSAIDMNFDGRVDVLRFYDKDGTSIAFEQHDFDFDGRIDEQAVYVAGRVDRREFDTNFDGLVDTWMWCNGPLVARAERARKKLGKVDTWEVYQDGLASEIKYDEDNNGKPEKWEVFQEGALKETRFDDNGDGDPDRTENVVLEGQGKDKPVSCDGSPLPVQESEAPAAPPATSGAESSSAAGEESPATTEKALSPASVTDSAATDSAEPSKEAPAEDTKKPAKKNKSK